MNVTVKKVSLIGSGPHAEYMLPDVPASHGPGQEFAGEELLSLWLPDGSEVYETQAGETAVRVPDPSLRDGLRLTLAEAVAMFGRYARPAAE